ncbi:GlxA family transcriptional regulator [Bradyrhizobium jicamae]|uniref:GlxA family transcriptional regulator n=1 Tax=Bradyrhizobium jicamae TaxID=280332 RepID=UPI001BA57B85|nr:GlxA family transcriptional regulator [Bradyrhizobium jicamae]MBR0931740.1 GlxA family transcriptional regulator [Bradyrhizobium jicamae]
MPSDTCRRIWVVVFPGFELLDLSGPLCALNLASELHGASYRVEVISAHGGSVACGSGVPVHTLRASRSKSVDTVLVVGGGTDSAINADADTVALIRKMAPRARRVASVCTGAFLLSAAGLLDGRSATTHWRFAALMQRRFPHVRVDADKIFVRDGSVWTSAGITSGIDLTLALIEDDFGIEVSKAVARDMVVYHRRSGGQSQFSALLELEPASDRVRDALNFAREHLHEPLPVDRLAAAARISARQFARLFLKETGDTPARVVERLRAEAALPRIQEGTEPIEIVARKVGFGDKDRMRRAFLRIYGQPPRALRRATAASKPRAHIPL